MAPTNGCMFLERWIDLNANVDNLSCKISPSLNFLLFVHSGFRSCFLVFGSLHWYLKYRLLCSWYVKRKSTPNSVSGCGLMRRTYAWHFSPHCLPWLLFPLHWCLLYTPEWCIFCGSGEITMLNSRIKRGYVF